MEKWIGFLSLLLLLACQVDMQKTSFPHRLQDLRTVLADRLAGAPIPPVAYRPELDANARFSHDTIWVGRVQPAFQSDEDLIALLHHEYLHSQLEAENRYPVALDSTGEIVQWMTEEWYAYQPTEYRIAQGMKQFQDSLSSTFLDLSSAEQSYQLRQMRTALATPQQLPFKYAPSNLALEEIEIYETQLKATENGLYRLSSAARAEIAERLYQQKDTWQRRKAYEAKHQLAPTGASLTLP